MNAIDTNVLVYAISTDEPVKGPAAMALLDRLSLDDTILPWQVACEFGAALNKLIKRGQAQEDDFDALGLFRARFELVMPGPAVLDLGIRVHRAHGISYWDALLLAACAEAGVDRLYSEDVPGHPDVLGVNVVNPFA
jgi:predicted nucleic acid-binding protein